MVTVPAVHKIRADRVCVADVPVRTGDYGSYAELGVVIAK